MNYDARIDTSRAVAVLHGLQSHGEGVVGLLELSRLLRLLASIGPKEHHVYPEKDASAYDRAWPMMVSLRENDMNGVEQDDKRATLDGAQNVKRRYGKRFTYSVVSDGNGGTELMAFLSPAARRRKMNSEPNGRIKKAESIDVYVDFSRDEIIAAKNKALSLEMLAGL